MRVVICGAGTAGCVAAARLSQDPAPEVTLLELGPHYRPGRWPPALTHAHRIIKDTHDWGYLARAGASPRIVHVPRGRVVGRSSVTNGAIALRGHPEHYDEWDALVDRVRVRGGRATGVETIGPDGPELLPADVVIVTLGTYATPAALLRSGIGPPAELARHGIATVAPVEAVGRAMQDHPKVPYRFDLALPAPPRPSPWYQCLLTGAHEVGGQRRVYQVTPYSGTVEGGPRFSELNVQVADARSRRAIVRLQSADPADQAGHRHGLVPRPGRPGGRRGRRRPPARGRRRAEEGRAEW